MAGHALHSPNITAVELASYYAMPMPERSKNSLIEISNHDSSLLSYLDAPVDGRLTRELAKSAASVVPMSKEPLSTLPPPATYAQGTFAQQQRQQQQALLQALNPADVPLEKFVALIIKNSRVKVTTLVYALLVLDRLREKMPPMAQGMACRGHRIFLVAVVLSSKYLNDYTSKNRYWAHWTRRIFQGEEITLMERQWLELLQYQLHFTEAQLIQRLEPLMAEQPEPKSSRLTVNSRRNLPLTLVTHSSNAASVNVIAEPKPEAALTAKQFLLQRLHSLRVCWRI